MILISRDLKEVVDSQQGNISQRNLLKEYLKKRVPSLIFIVVVVVLLVESTIFMKMGLNIGGLLIELFKKFVGL